MGVTKSILLIHNILLYYKWFKDVVYDDFLISILYTDVVVFIGSLNSFMK